MQTITALHLRWHSYKFQTAFSPLNNYVSVDAVSGDRRNIYNKNGGHRITDPLGRSLDSKLKSLELLSLSSLPRLFRHKHKKGEMGSSSKEFYSS